MQNQTVHTVKQQDTLCSLAIHYRTTIENLLYLNPQVNPHSLITGSQIVVNSEFTNASVQCNNPKHCDKKMALVNDMRYRWEQHVYWTRMLIMSISEHLQDQTATTNKLLQNPNDIAAIYAKFYPETVAKKISALLTEHLQIGAQIITAVRDGKTAQAEMLQKSWAKNADDMAKAFASINPHYNYEELQKMLMAHLNMTSQEVVAYISKDYVKSIAAFDNIEKEALEMADYFSNGIMMQFNEQF